jgi:hypothetical protein
MTLHRLLHERSAWAIETFSMICVLVVVLAIVGMLRDTPTEEFEIESSLHVTNTTYSGLQEHRIIVYTATGQKAKPKVHLSTKEHSS